jgi:DUF1365 family protein
MYATTTPALAEPQLGTGQVRHTRLRPVRNAFAYPSFFFLLPMRRLRAAPWPALARNRWAPLAFHDADHGEGGADALAWLEQLLAREGIADAEADGEIWLHCYPRVWGYSFKPVSFWYVQRASGALTAIVAEVNNTFGERHCYVLRPAAGASGWGQELRADKVFYVSPFCQVAGDYRFRFLRIAASPSAPARSVARIEHHDAQGALLLTSVSGTLAPLSASTQRRALWRMPWLTLGVVARIHWQAFKLWRAGVPVVARQT